MHACVYIRIHRIFDVPPIAHTKTPNSFFDRDASPLCLNMKVTAMIFYI